MKLPPAALTVSTPGSRLFETSRTTIEGLGYYQNGTGLFLLLRQLMQDSLL